MTSKDPEIDAMCYKNELKRTPKQSNYVPMKMWKELNKVFPGDNANGSGVYWDAFSPPQNLAGTPFDLDNTQSSQSQENRIEASPFAEILGQKRRLPPRRPAVPPSNLRSKFQRQKSMESLKNGSSKLYKVKDCCVSKQSSFGKDQPKIAEEKSHVAAVTCEQSVKPCSPIIKEVSNDFPEDSYDEELVLASQRFEAEESAKALLDTPKAPPRSKRRPSGRRLDAEIEDTILVNNSLFESSVVELVNDKDSCAKGTDELEVFGDEDDSWLSQLPC